MSKTKYKYYDYCRYTLKNQNCNNIPCCKCEEYTTCTKENRCEFKEKFEIQNCTLLTKIKGNI